MKKFLMSSCIAVALAVTATAQVGALPSGKWWRNQRVVQHLGLTDEQQTKLDAIFRDSADELIDLKAEVEKRGLALRRELDAPEPNRQNVQRTAQSLSAARARLFERELMMFIDMRRELKSDQWSRFRQVLESREGMRPRRAGRMHPGRGVPRPQ